ncbi:hypothetical protein H4Q26_013013 [Puccinia striiformis f. sp. tritici PST-130]|nr:hypothetical protein H4Q26_013013 [Puccinia striiformis f. sp. tritici PST-130]
MPDSADEMLETPNLDQSEIKQHRPQGDLVTQGFDNLISKCCETEDGTRPYPASARETFPTDPVNLKKALIAQLQTSLLPFLRQQLTSLSKLLEPSELKAKPGPQLATILEIQSTLEPTIDQLNFALDTLCPEALQSIPIRSDDQHEEEAKIFRLHGLEQSLKEPLFEHLISFFETSCRLIQQLGLSTETGNHSDYIAGTRACLDLWATSYLHDIDTAIKWLSGSELELIQHLWADELDDIERVLLDFDIWTNISADEVESRRVAGRHTPSEVARELSKSLIPVLKVSRLFFKKSSGRGMHRRRSPFFTKMSSGQLDSLAGSTAYSVTFFKAFRSILLKKPFPPRFPSEILIGKAQQLKDFLRQSFTFSPKVKIV